MKKKKKEQKKKRRKKNPLTRKSVPWTRSKKRVKPVPKKEGIKNWEKYLKSIYFDPKHPASFQGAKKLHQSVKEEGLFKIGLTRLRRWLQENESYSLNKPLRRKFKRGRVIVASKGDQYDADLADFQKWGRENDGVRFLLVVIDIFSRYAWVEPLVNKSNTTVRKAFEKIFEEEKPRRLRTDAGKEFTGNIMDKFFTDNNVTHFLALNETKANYAERLIKTLKSKIWRYITNNNSFRYVDRLADIVHSYNHTEHSTIGMKPINVTETVEKGLWWTQYKPKKPYMETGDKTSSDQFTFKVGDLVRIPHLRTAFAREYDQKWTGEIFVINESFVRQGIQVYTLLDQNDELVLGTFYKSELQRVNPDDKKLWKIDQVLEERGSGKNKRLYVKWKFWKKDFNSWIKASTLKHYK
jgi:hypothetical protein